MTTDERFDALDTKMSKLTESLETSVRRQRITITALVLVAVAAAVMAAAPQSRDATFDEITAKKLWIVNDAGKQQAYLGADEDGGILTINNAAGKQQAGLKVGYISGGYLVIYNAAGERQVYLGAEEDGGRLTTFDKTGERVVRRIP